MESFECRSVAFVQISSAKIKQILSPSDQVFNNLVLVRSHDRYPTNTYDRCPKYKHSSKEKFY